MFNYREQSTQFCNKEALETLKKLFKENEELNKVFDDALMVNEAISLLDSDFSLEEIETRYEQLFNLKNCGWLIRDLFGTKHILIDSDSDIPEYVHDIQFNIRKELKNKHKKEKENKKVKKKNEVSNDGTSGTDSEGEDWDTHTYNVNETTEVPKEPKKSKTAKESNVVNQNPKNQAKKNNQRKQKLDKTHNYSNGESFCFTIFYRLFMISTVSLN